MHKVTYSMTASLDGFAMDADGRFDWSEPDDEVFRVFLDQLRGVDVHLMGRKLYETMLFWETAEDVPGLSEAEREWTTIWKALPKVVFSRTLTAVQGNARLATDGIEREIARLRAAPGDGDIAIGGPELAAEIAGLGLIDEYQLVIAPVLVGGGTPYFPHGGDQVGLELVETRVFAAGSVFLRHRVKR